MNSRSRTRFAAFINPSKTRLFSAVMTVLFLGLYSYVAYAQPAPPRDNYLSPTARGIRPRFHKPTLPSAVLSIHGLSSFPMGSDGNLASHIQPGPGFRVAGAWHPSQQVSAELSYRASTHETTLPDTSDRGFFQSIHIGANLYPMKKEDTFRPQVSIGTHALGYFSERLSSHKMLGFGVDLAGGVGVFLSRHSCISIGLRYLGTFVYSADKSYFGESASSSTFTNQISPEIGLVFYP